MANVDILTGPHRSGRSQAIDERVAAAWGRVRLVLPARPAALRRIEHLLTTHDLPGAWGNPVLALEDLAHEIVQTVTPNVHVFDELERRLLLEDAIAALPANLRASLPEATLASPGFASHMLRVITQLKQAAVEPGDFRARIAKRARPSWIDPMVAGVYAAYQEALQGTAQFDRVGVYWTAAEICRTDPPAWIGDLDLIAFDAFDDFTPSEFRLIKAMAAAENAPPMVAGLVHDTEQPTLADTYAIPQRTFIRLREAFPESRHESFREHPPQSHVEYAASHLFRRDIQPMPDGLEPNLILAARVDAVQEAEHLARDVKALVMDKGVPMSDIVLAYRDPGDMADTLRGVFAECGIPLIVNDDPPLTRSAVAAFVLNAMDATMAWGRDAVVDVLASPWYQPADGMPDDVRFWAARLAMEAGIVAGYMEWHSQLKTLAERLQGDHYTTEHLRRRLANGPGLLDVMQRELVRLRKWRDAMPGKATLAEHAAALAAGIDELGVFRGVQYCGDEAVAEREVRGLTAFRRLLRRIERWPSKASATMDHAEFAARLRQMMRVATYALPRPDTGVRCVNLETLRHLSAPYVFIGGANEGTLPRPPSSNAVYSEADIADLQGAGIALDTKGDRVSREMLLFHHALASAETGVAISWHVASRQGKAAAPSAFVDDLRSLLPREYHGARAAGTADFIPEAERVASRRDACNFAARRGGIAAIRSEAPLAAHAAAVEQERQSPRPAGIYDGVLHEAALRNALAETYGATHPFSVSQLESYAACPFLFFVKRVLDIEPLRTPEAQFDPIVRGSILHRVLEGFHRAYTATPVAAIDAAEAERAMAAELDRHFDTLANESGAPAGVRAMEKRRLTAMLMRYLEVQRDPDEAAWRPAYFEVGFGRTGKTVSAAPGKPEPFPYDIGNETLLFAGRIDRLDAGDACLRIIDYKTKLRITAGDIKKGVNLQLAIYAEAVEKHLFPGDVCGEARYLEIGRAASVGVGGKKQNKMDEVRATAREQCAIYVQGIREGRFPPFPHDNEVPYDLRVHRPCRYDRGRMDRKMDASP